MINNIPSSSTSGEDDCVCDLLKEKGIVKCDNKNDTQILDCYCSGSNDGSHELVIGSCFYNCGNKMDKTKDSLYSNISSDVCSPFNRSGLFCGKCNNNTYPLVLSFDLKCIGCTRDWRNWVKFFAVSTIPSTLMFFIFVIFRINITSSFLHGFVLYSQIISSPGTMRFLLHALKSIPKLNLFNEVVGTTKIVTSLYGFSNLDFFRPLLPDNCLQLTTLQVFSLDYVVAIYPLVLTLLSYAVVLLYYQNVKIVVIITHPFRKIFSQFQRAWHIKSSIIDAYATFFLLSFVKILNTSVDILMPTEITNCTSGEHYTASYYDASLKYFKGPHFILGLIALIVLIIFIALPTLVLLLYPLYLVVSKKKKNSCSSYPLSFMNSLYLCYKDGSEPKSFDCRWFSAIFLFFRALLAVVFSVTFGSVYFPLAVIIIFIFVMVLITIKPYKPMYSHILKYDVTFLLLLALFFLSIISIEISSVKDKRLVSTSYYMTIIFIIAPLTYIICAIIHWIVSTSDHCPNVMRRMVTSKMYKKEEHPQEEDNLIADRLMHPTEYMANNSASPTLSVSRTEISEETY